MADYHTPRFCPGCGASCDYRSEPRTPLWERAAEQSCQEPPEAVQEALHTDAYVTGCSECRHVSHVIGHEAHG